MGCVLSAAGLTLLIWSCAPLQAGLFVAIYPLGVPLLLLAALFTHREQIQEIMAERMELEQRDTQYTDETLQKRDVAEIAKRRKQTSAVLLVTAHLFEKFEVRDASYHSACCPSNNELKLRLPGSLLVVRCFPDSHAPVGD